MVDVVEYCVDGGVEVFDFGCGFEVGYVLLEVVGCD